MYYYTMSCRTYARPRLFDVELVCIKTVSLTDVIIRRPFESMDELRLKQISMK